MSKSSSITKLICISIMSHVKTIRARVRTYIKDNECMVDYKLGIVFFSHSLFIDYSSI